ncbi:MAG: hypothetical protein IPO09_22270 [Anaeromyxobacter sp.]|nr:hypothetical protein [Anaeromyxobacter sp.]MBL0274511.1 hypothetical protein [Anaeromyxobacter sp.]
MATECCQYCGVDLDEHPPGEERGVLYGVACSRCPPARRRTLMMARPAQVATLCCPDCGASIAPAGSHDDVLVVRELVYEVCSACGERCGVSRVRTLRDLTAP